MQKSKSSFSLFACSFLLWCGCQERRSLPPIIIEKAAGAAGTNPQLGKAEQPAFALQIDKPGGVAVVGEQVWVADRVAMKLRAYDLDNGTEITSLAAPGPWPTGLAYDGKLLWVADKQRERLFGIDLESQLVMREIPSPKNPLGLAHDGEHLWLADGKRVHQISTEDGTTMRTFRAPAWDGEGRGSEQLGLAFHDGYLWVADRHQDRIYRVHATRGDVVDTLPAPSPLVAGLGAHGTVLWVADVNTPGLHRIDTKALPPRVESDPREEKVVIRRRIENGGPGALTRAQIWMAIPSAGPGQKLHGDPVFDPAPAATVIDQWGQKLARFDTSDLDAGESFEVSMTVRATLYAVQAHIDPANIGSLADIPRQVARSYLGDASKYRITHASIAAHTQKAVAGESHPYWMARNIASYIQDRMHYELSGGWNIAPTVIDRGSGSCSEYTFVFIAMCRAAGIPARYVGAVVVRDDDASTDEVFHRWAEIYLPGYGWVPFDVQAGDKPEPEKRAEVIGNLPHRFLITTTGGGGSTVLGWDYNSTARWVCKGRCQVSDLYVGDWYPEHQAAETP